MSVTCTELVKEYVTPAETVRALDGVTIEVAPGDFVALEGASGSGKTTLLSLIAGLDAPTSGSVQVDAHAMSQINSNARARVRLESIGVIFQDNNLIDEFSILENVLVPLQALGMTPHVARQAALEALARMGILELQDRRPRDVSGGQRQRAGIARAIAGPRRLLLAGEPTGALDSENSKSLFGAMADLASHGTTIIIATHDPLIEGFARKVIRLRDGRVES
jgi:putative ABC transport system ATP-binding protein